MNASLGKLLVLYKQITRDAKLRLEREKQRKKKLIMKL